MGEILIKKDGVTGRGVKEAMHFVPLARVLHLKRSTAEAFVVSFE